MSRSKKLECRIAELVQQFPIGTFPGEPDLDAKAIHALNELLACDELLYTGILHFNDYRISRTGADLWDSRWFWVAYRTWEQLVRYQFTIQDTWCNGYVTHSTLMLTDTETEAVEEV